MLPAFQFDYGAYALRNGGPTDWVSGDIRLLLLKRVGGIDYDPPRDAQFLSDLDLATYEVTVSGYSRQALTGMAITLDTVGHRLIFDADDPSFTALAAGEEISGAIAFDHAGGADSARTPLAFLPLAPVVATNGANVPVSIPESGFFYQALT